MDDQAEPVSAGLLVNSALRGELHDAIDAVMSERGSRLPDSDLKTQLRVAVDRAVDARLSAASSSGEHAGALQTARQGLRTVPQTIDTAVSRFDSRVEAALESGKAGSKRGVAYALALSARLAPLVVPLLLEIAHDERKLKAVEHNLEQILARRLKPGTAKSVASATVKAAQALVRRYGKPESR